MNFDMSKAHNSIKIMMKEEGVFKKQISELFIKLHRCIFLLGFYSMLNISPVLGAPIMINNGCLSVIELHNDENCKKENELGNDFCHTAFSTNFLRENQDTTEYPFDFAEVANVRGILPNAANIYGHAAAWGDINGDGWPDLYIVTFMSDVRKSKPNMLFINNGGQFTLSKQQSVRTSTRSTGAIFVDLDNDGDLDLYVGNMPVQNQGIVGTSMFENDGTGKLINISEGNEACPQEF